MLFTVHPTRHFHFGTHDGTTWSEKVTFLNSGNVGIGTVNPSQKLDVAGYVKGTGLCIGNDCRTSWPSIVTRFVSSDCGETTRTCPIGYTTVSTWHVGYSGAGYCLWIHYTDDAGSRKDGWVSLCVKQ